MRDQDLEYMGDAMPGWVKEHVTVRVKATPVMRRFGFDVRGQSAGDERAWPGEVGALHKRVGNGWWDWAVEFSRGRRAVLYAKDVTIDGDLVRCKATTAPHGDMKLGISGRRSGQHGNTVARWVNAGSSSGRGMHVQYATNVGYPGVQRITVRYEHEDDHVAYVVSGQTREFKTPEAAATAAARRDVDSRRHGDRKFGGGRHRSRR